MKNKFPSTVISLMISGFAVALFSAAAPSQAQTELKEPHRFRVKLGAAFPTDGDTQDLLGNAFLTGGVSYDLPFKNAFASFPRNAVFAYFDATGKKGTRGFRELKMNYYALGIGARLYPFQKQWAEKAQVRFYFGGGIGVYVNTYQLKNERGQFFEDQKNSAKLGGKGFLGVDFGKRIFLEADFSTPNESRSNTANISAGLRL